MKKTQRTEAFRNIRRNRISFLSIIIISMLAVTAYLGLGFSAEGILKSADASYQAGNTADIEIRSAALIPEEELQAVRSARKVTDAEGILSLPSRVSSGTEIKDIVLRTCPERISLPCLKEGRLPGAEDECAVEQALAVKMNYRIGDRLELAGTGSLADKAIRQKAYTVTGIFITADHLTEMVSFEPQVLVTRAAFNAGFLPEGKYTNLLVRTEAEDPYRFSSGYRDSAKQTCGQLEALNSKWLAIALDQTASYNAMVENTGLLDKVAVTFSMLFVVIAALVIYSTIGRLVDLEGRLVGAEKAMGLKNSEIFAKYLMFGAGGTLAGTLFGILIAYFVFERIVLFFFGTVYRMEKWAMAFRPVPVLIVIAGAGILGFLAVFIACRRLMKSTAVSLMNGETAAGQHRRRKKGSSGSGALYMKIILRNMRTDWKRVLVSIVSIAGSCMLLMIGFSLKYAISRVTQRQYEEIQRFAMDITVDPAAGADAAGHLRAVLDEEALPCAAVYMKDLPYEARNEMGSLTLVCPEKGETLADYYCLKDARTGEVLAVPETGALVSRMFSVKYRLDAGDRFTLYDSSMNAHEIQIAGVFENYLGVNVFCSSTYAAECLGEKPACNTLLLRNSPQDSEALRQKLSGVKGFLSLASSRKQEALFSGVSAMLNLIILLLGILAAMIACFILLNLVNTYVNQKRNELTIMRINGYTTRETIRYASMECYWITALGILLGLAAGAGFSVYIINLIAMPSMCFITEPVWISFAASAVITAVISAVIHFFAFRRIRSLKLSDIQK